MRFVWIEHDEEFGTSGWKPESMPNANAGDGRSVAHDAIEHGLADTVGEFEGECQAFGAMIAGRGEAGTLGTAYEPDWRVHIASDLNSFIRERFQREGGSMSACPHRVRVPPEVTADMQHAVSLAKRQLVRDEGMKARVIERLRPHIIAWMRHGYRRMSTAMRRAGAGPGVVACLFDDICARCPSGEFEGQRMSVSVSLRRGNARMTMHEDEEGY